MARKLVSAAVIMAMMATNAHAAYLSDIQGAVLVNNQPVTSNIEVAPGDRVKAVTGSVKVVYNNGTTVPVTVGETVVVLANNVSPSGPSGTYRDVSEPDYSTYYIVGGLVVAGGVGLGIALSQNNKPKSP